ncbi:MAG TPA: cysteine-rich CWC family protein [Verrucomicrobiae bacterium]|nr:cysteine-rich CWC family protein [Verrucomicrobiae bacterium]
MKEINSSECPLCREPNCCGLAAGGKDCWCLNVQIPMRSLMRVPPTHIGKACLCQACATAPLTAKPATTRANRPSPTPGGFVDLPPSKHIHHSEKHKL